MGERKLYTNYGKEFKLDGFDCLFTCPQYTVLAKADTAVKLYTKPNMVFGAIDPNVFRALRGMNCEAVINLDKLLYPYNSKFLQTLLECGYTFERFETDDASILDMSCDEFSTRVVDGLSVLSDQLAHRSIVIDKKLTPASVRLVKDGVCVVVNPERFRMQPENPMFKQESELEKAGINKIATLNCIKGLIIKAANDEGIDAKGAINKAFSFDVSPNTDLAICVRKTLRNKSIRDIISRK